MSCVRASGWRPAGPLLHGGRPECHHQDQGLLLFVSESRVDQTDCYSDSWVAYKAVCVLLNLYWRKQLCQRQETCFHATKARGMNWSCWHQAVVTACSIYITGTNHVASLAVPAEPGGQCLLFVSYFTKFIDCILIYFFLLISYSSIFG